MMGDPPLLAGGLNAIVAAAFPAVAPVMVGGEGGPAGVAGEDGADAGPVPAALVALAVKV